MRTFFTTPEVNGNAPRYGVGCGFDCPPGPGYWPIEAPEHPSAMGWRNPTHVINRRAWPGGVPEGMEVVVSVTAPETTPLWSAPEDVAGAEQVRVYLWSRANDASPSNCWSALERSLGSTYRGDDLSAVLTIAADDCTDVRCAGSRWGS